MENNILERRACKRFEIPEATLDLRQSKPIFGLKAYKEASCKIEEISRGGIRFLCQKNLEIDNKIKMTISNRKDNFFQTLKGQVKWSSPYQTNKFGYRI